MNRVSLVGRIITKDPELRHLSEGRVQTSFIIAINRNFKNANGEIDADFVTCSIWGRLATNVVKYCGKGSLIGVGGRLQSRSYERGDGKRVYVVEVIADEVRFLALKERDGNNDQKIEQKQQLNTQTNAEPAVPSGFTLPKEEAEGLPMG
ncbi:single-stranded DNA-binding protein [Rummeliibacillus sp. JY-2-4R]